MEKLKEKIKYIVQFGSTVEGHPGESSDIDIALVLDRELEVDSDTYLKLIYLVKDILDFDEDKLDISIIDESDMLLAYEAIVKGKLLSGDEDKFIQYQTYIMKKYNDWQWLSRHYWDNFKEDEWLEEDVNANKRKAALQKAREIVRMKALDTKFNKLKADLKEMDSLLIAFSGGVDSTFLLKVAHDVLGDQVAALTSASETYPAEQLEEAKELAQEIGVRHIVTSTTELENHDFTKNDKLRCYHCKLELFSELKEVAAEEGYAEVADGANYDDYANDYRPGLKAAEELGVRSPLKEAEITKEEIRELSRDLGLPTWDKPAFACLSSRFPYGEQITADKLELVDAAERYLRQFDFEQLRVRHHDQHTARIEVTPADMEFFLENRQQIVARLKEIGYTYVTLDLEGYRTGSMNEVLDLN
ncbi:ATP-dependent sacrificial sulfur transferase LarE [Fuchsiella alkaliacetigena]|uniref:ATP-dependent sacrificial sulfur transferase LarE n=1 Tax=Fuchsiella alkaliacetigena TaxID=957042 RepID=UPI002009EBC9|nr:ATP-dependent sacrificial sulfur transferase LarE [Fuchsiella alkaliacetigena]MCK8824101.1 ATP-dependent sacrificial sulfur transferase LarE [Fuchsiella alkaliacetigena]